MHPSRTVFIIFTLLDNMKRMCDDACRDVSDEKEERASCKGHGIQAHAVQSTLNCFRQTMQNLRVKS